MNYRPLYTDPTIGFFRDQIKNCEMELDNYKVQTCLPTLRPYAKFSSYILNL